MNPQTGTVLRPAWIALAVGLIPVVAVHASYAISVHQGHVPACMPYLEGCTSISRAARFGLANLVFKGLMLPVAALLVVFWWIAGAWIESQRGALRRITAMRALGMIGALFLILYASFLGADGELYQWLRRYGVTVYFSFTVLAQMLLAALLPLGRLRQSIIALCAVMLLLGLASIPLQHLIEDRRLALDSIEWCYALLMTSVFVLVGIGWAKTPPTLSMRAR